MRRLDVRDPVADRLARRLLQRLRAEVDAAHLGAEQVHPLDVRPLAAHVLLAHVDDALEPEARADRRGRDAVLAGAGLGDDALLAEPPREHRLAERVVELVRAGVEEILALEVDALAGREPLGERERRRAAGVRRQRARAARRGTRRRRAPRASRARARRAPGSASRGRSGRRRSPNVGVMRRAASTKARTRAWSLMPGARLERRRRVDRPRVHGVDRRAHVVRAEPAGEHDAALAVRRCVSSAPGRSPSHGRSSDARDRLAVAQERRASRPRTVPPSSRVELDEVGAASPRPRRRRRRPRAPCPARRARRGARRGLSSARMKPSRSAPASTAASTSSCRVRPQTLTSGRESSSRSFAPRVGRLHQRRADEDRVRAGELGGGALRARVDRALGDHDAVARRARDELELRVRGRSRRSRGRAR